MDPILMLDIFSGDSFSARSLSDTLNLVPIKYGLIGQMGLFNGKGVKTTTAIIERKNGVLNLISSGERGVAAPKNKSGKRDVVPLIIPHFPLDDVLNADDIQNVREFGTDALKTAVSATNDKLEEISMKHDITLEWLRVNALGGKILDADGTVLLDLFDTFGVTQVVVDFALDTDDTDVKDKCMQVKGSIEDNLLNDTMTDVMGLWAPDAFADFTSHPEVKAAYANYQNMVQTASNYAAPTANPLRDDVRQGFYFGGIIHREYRGKATDSKGTTRKFIPDGTAQFFPIGTNNLYKQYHAPADWLQFANTPGLPRYAQVIPDRAGRYVEILTQQNTLPLVLQPKVLVKGTA